VELTKIPITLIEHLLSIFSGFRDTDGILCLVPSLSAFRASLGYNIIYGFICNTIIYH
ncbi:6442_t:CDS:1, partial [Ambispora leptoticha]